MNLLRSPRHLISIVTLTAAAGIVLVGCSPASSIRSAPSAAVTTTQQTAPSASHAPASTTATPTASPGTRASVCATGQLTGRIGERDGQPAGSGSGMSQEQLSIILANTSATACTLQGWPGVSFVGHGNGTQIGAAAVLERAVPHPTTTLRPGGSAQAYLTIRSAALYNPSACTPVKPDGFRVYPPGSKSSLFIAGGGAGDGTVCSNAKDGLLGVAAFIPNP